MSNTLLSTRQVVLEIQKKGLGKSIRKILDVDRDNPVRMGGYTRSLGGITRNHYIAPASRKYRPRPVRRGTPEAITAELSVKMQALNWLEQNLDEDSRAALYVRFVESGDPANPMNYARVQALSDVALESYQYSDLVEDGTNEEDDVTLTVPINAAEQAVILPVSAGAILHGLTQADDCEALCIAEDADGNLYIGTGVDPVGLKPFVLKYTAETETWSETEITALSAAIDAITVAGEYVLWASGTTIHRAHRDDLGTQVSTTAAAAINALLAIDAARVVAAGASGTVLLSEDGGLSWTALSSGTSNALQSIAARNTVTWYLGGASGTLLKYNNGTFSSVAVPTALAAGTVNSIALPDTAPGFNRESLIVIGGSDGKAYEVEDDGSVAAGDWSEITHPLNSSGSVDAVAFTGFLGQTLYLVHSAATGESTVMRDWSGGVGGNNHIETVASTTSPANGGYNAILVDDHNAAWAVGKDGSNNLLITKVEA